MTPDPTPQHHDHGAAGFCTDHGQAASCPRCAHPWHMHRLGACEFDWIGQPTLPCGCDSEPPETSPAPDERTETVARVLREHWPHWDRCRCGWRATGAVALTSVDHRAHQAAAVVAALDQLPRTALRRLWEERQEARAALDRVRAGINDAIPYLGERELAHVAIRAALDPEEPR